MLTQSQQLYRLKCDIYAKEGWSMLRGDVLPQYAASLRGSDTAGLMATCLTMLSLPEDGAVQLEREQVQNEFEECGKLLGPEMKGFKALVTMPALQIEPVKSQCSTFFGELDDVYEPILLPAACPPPIVDGSTCPHGAKRVRAGDVVELEVEMHSLLSRALSVTNVSLTLLLVGGRAMKAETGYRQDEPGSPQQPGVRLNEQPSAMASPRRFGNQAPVNDNVSARWVP